MEDKNLQKLASFALDCTPYVENIKGVIEGATGKDTITGEELSTFERTLSFVSAAPIAGKFAKGSSNL